MSSKHATSNIHGTHSSDYTEEDLLTVEGYTKIFESCENTSDVFRKLQTFNENFSAKYFMKMLENTNYSKHIQSIYSYYEEIRSKNQLMNYEDYTRVIETFSLLENVFRNVLLRPYIPAYRTINKNCGRYRCYIDSKAEQFFKTLGFQGSSDNLLTYTETDLLKTVIYALACTSFWDHYTCKLDVHNKSKNLSPQPKRTN